MAVGWGLGWDGAGVVTCFGEGRGPNGNHHLSHTESVRLRLLVAVCFPQFLGEWGGSGSFK